MTNGSTFSNSTPTRPLDQTAAATYRSAAHAQRRLRRLIGGSGVSDCVASQLNPYVFLVRMYSTFGVDSVEQRGTRRSRDCALALRAESPPRQTVAPLVLLRRLVPLIANNRADGLAALTAVARCTARAAITSTSSISTTLLTL